ncbi:MAG: AAA family ATPase [Kaiparowitsia implicata GSE-PSE-MK54-09C]|jgi:ribulose bisphosphate carboxylase small subunit|nr:AAA family ATPase [Kaiparowitsia implicata GSE-PSE-MK54-09C]
MAYYIPPTFLDRLAVHITKNFLDLPSVNVPLILGIHGRKGEGKTFMCDQVFKRMGVAVVMMSAGELESPDAGDPARLLRLRYREAGEWSRVHGRMAVLMINDIDAGIGRMDSGTQYTVNTQLVNATLMNIADNPTNVQLPGSYDAEPTQRIPVILTGNDFATLYAPLIRDGRMEKFFWDPTHEDRIGIVSGMFAGDGVPKAAVETLVGTFPEQATDFFGALRSRLYDEQIAQLIHTIGVDKVSQAVVHAEGKPVEFHPPDVELPHLITIGNSMVREQQRIRELRLVEEYNVALQPQASVSRSQRGAGAVQADAPITQSPQAGQSQSIGANRSENATATPHSTDRLEQLENGHGGHTNAANATLPPETLTVLQQTVARGDRLGIEWVEARRFRTGAWQSYGMVDGNANGDQQRAIATLSDCLKEHPRDYVRLVSIQGNSQADRRRTGETIVQRPQ